MRYDKTIAFEAEIKSTGSAIISATEKFRQYARIHTTKDYRASKNSYESDLRKKYDFLKMDSVFVSGAESDTGSFENFFTGSYDLEQSGEYLLLHYNMFFDLKVNPFTTENRFTKIDFGYKSTYNLEATFSLPENMFIESLPKDAREATRDNSLVLTRRFDRSGSTIKIKMNIEINRAEFYSEEYDMVKKFFTKMIDMVAEPVVLKTK